jgi:hypothetical protein
MDEDDDFFDMRSRFKIPEKKQKRPLGEDSSSNSGSSSIRPFDRINIRFR